MCNKNRTSTSTSKFNFKIKKKLQLQKKTSTSTSTYLVTNVTVAFSSSFWKRGLYAWHISDIVFVFEKSLEVEVTGLQLEVEISKWKRCRKFVSMIWCRLACQILPVWVIRTLVSRFFLYLDPLEKRGYIKQNKYILTANTVFVQYVFRNKCVSSASTWISEQSFARNTLYRNGKYVN